MATNIGKKFIRIDISSDTVCPWCFVGKRNLDKAIALASDQYDFEVPFDSVICASISTGSFTFTGKMLFCRLDGIPIFSTLLRLKKGLTRKITTEVFKGLGLEYNMSGLTGSSLDSHRLLYFAGQQGLDKQNNLAEELFLGYFTQGRYIGDREFLVEAARKAGVEGAADFLEDPNNGLKEVNEELQQYSSNISGVPHFVLNGKYQLSGGQPPESFIRAFQAASNITA